MTAAAPPVEAAPGLVLKEARERLGVGLSEIAASMHLDEEVVLALEQGRHEDLPALAYVRGYLRTYARLVGLDPETLEEGMRGVEAGPVRGPVLRRSQSRQTFAVRSQRHIGVLLAAIVGVLLLAAAVLLWFVWRLPDTWFSAAPEVVAPEVVAADASVAGTAIERVAGAPVERLAPESEPLAPSDADPPAIGEIPAPSASAPSSEGEPRASSDPVSPADAEPLPAVAVAPSEMDSSSDTLVLRFDESSWVEVRDAADRLIHADLGEPGQTATVAGSAPFSVVVGYAAGVRLDFNGDPVPLLPHTRENVARLVVGY